MPVAVVDAPLDVADPDDDAGEGMGDGVDLDAVHLARVDFARCHLQAGPEGVVDDLFLQVHEHLQGDVEEVAAAAGGVEHGGFADAPQDALAQFQQADPGIGFGAAGAGAVVALADGLGFQLHGVPFVAQGLHEDGFDDEQDVIAGGVVGAALAALLRIEAAFEEGAEDGGFDGFPIEAGGFGQSVQGLLLEFFDGHDIEERAVEVRDIAHEDHAAFVHGDEEVLHVLLEDGRFAARFLDDVGEDALGAVAAGGGQQADILGEEAEDELGQEIGDARRLGIPAAHVVGDELEGVGGVFGDLLGVAAGVQAFGSLEHGAEPVHDLGPAGDFGVAEFVDALFGVGEVAVDLPVVDVGDDQQRGIVQVFAVLQQLLVGGFEVFVFVGAFVFDGEMVFVEDIGASVAAGFLQGLLEDEGFAGVGFAVAAGHVDANQAADIEEVGLPALELAQGGVRPFVDEGLRGHGLAVVPEYTRLILPS